MTLRVIIVDDESPARRSVRRFLKKHEADIVEECSDGRSAVAAIRKKAPDLVFLDMQMPEMNGLEVIAAIGEAQMPTTIILTAYDRYAVQAFNLNVADYLLKPFGQERFDKSLERVKKKMCSNSRDIFPSTEIVELLDQFRREREFVERLPVSSNGRILLIDVQLIDWIEAEGNTTNLYVGSQRYELRETLSALQKKLDSKHFLRIHRSTIVNIRRIREIQPWFNGYHLVVIEGGKQLRMSRYQQDSLQRLLGVSAKG